MHFFGQLSLGPDVPGVKILGPCQAEVLEMLFVVAGVVGHADDRAVELAAHLQAEPVVVGGITTRTAHGVHALSRDPVTGGFQQGGCGGGVVVDLVETEKTHLLFLVIVVVPVHTRGDAAYDLAAVAGEPHLGHSMSVKGIFFLVVKVLHLVQQREHVMRVVPIDTVRHIQEMPESVFIVSDGGNGHGQGCLPLRKTRS